MTRTVLRRGSCEVIMGPGMPTVIIGEKINPTGRKKFAQALLNGDLSLVREDALAQVGAGADMLDVNVGAAGVNEVELLPKAVKLVSEVVDVPLCIDSSNPDALAAALEVYEGKALVNSVCGKAASLEKVLPVVKAYGAAVVGLCMDDQGIPGDVDGRVRIAVKILERAEQLGIPREDVLIDCLAMTVSSDHMAGRVTLETLGRISRELKANTILGASNVSFGLPDRWSINAAYFSMAIQSGLTSLIMDPNAPGLRRIVKATDLLMGYDEFAMNYLTDYRQFTEND
ncbi:MAG: dihydropteroate synthase [Clostridia bacterium]|nr:dihydropteroate synthase [Clostridia bacterium]